MGLEDFFQKGKNHIRRTLITGIASSALFLGCGKDSPTEPIIKPPVQEVNRPPRITSNPITQIDETSFYEYRVQATDPDGDPINYSLSEGPSWLSVSHNIVYGNAPEVLENTSFPIKIRVSDGKASVEQAYNLTVQNIFNTHVLSSGQLNNLSEVRDNSLIFSNPVDFSPRDIVASEINNKTPNGLLREITSISSDKKTIYTDQATLEQVVREASLSFSRILRPSSVQSSSSLEGISMSPAQTQNFDFNINLTNVVLFDLDRNLNTTHDQLIANGNIAFDTDFIFGLDISNHRLSNLDFRNTTNIKADVTLGSNIAGFAQTARIKIAEYNFHPFIAGYLPTPIPIPVVVVPTLGVYVGLDQTRINPFGVRVKQEATLNVGIVYDGSWEGVADFSNNFDFSIPVVQGDWELSAYAGPSLELMLYGIAGPFAGISARLRLESQDGDWKLYGGLGTILGVKMEVLKRGVSAQFREVINNEKLLAESGTIDPPDDTFTDPRDGQIYKIIGIGNQTWMAENLNYNHENSWYYNDDSSHEEIYGRLYGKTGALESCPTDWTLPTDDEWKILFDFLGRGSPIAGKLKSTGTIEEGTGLWHFPNTGATNEFRFSALPGGLKDDLFRGYERKGYDAYFWVHRPSLPGADAYYFKHNSEFLNSVYYASPEGISFSIRCIKDQ